MKLQEQETSIASGSLEVIKIGTTPISTPGSTNPGYGRNKTIYWMLIQNTYSLLENLALVLQGIATWLAIQKVISSFCQTS